MADKTLRIIIADTSLSRLVQVEKSLNRLGYFRILPVLVHEELTLLNKTLDVPFDVLIASTTFALETLTNSISYGHMTEKFKHTLLYGPRESQVALLSNAKSRAALAPVFTEIVNDQVIQAFMASADPCDIAFSA
ncbi:hypothetical protein [Pseudomonas fluorescens]|uniref:hypothetical protein n=1 Tax=Pseudomonas fluorescens TaxID=294 RepID=UPI001A9E186B|nr:hypothetical protein [Pseudomonas fluorescens]QTD31483.1 hypothetical protein JZM58_19540 [Pseudomonas fluorescens]